jgi:uncharacterized protein (TIGR02118 family)
MTVKLIVLYTQPDDVEAFESHYNQVHAPLVDNIPGLQSWFGMRIVGAADEGDLTYFRIAELTFADQDTFQSAMGSSEGRQTAADYGEIAPPGSRMFVAGD